MNAHTTSKPTNPSEPISAIRKVGIIGAGQMGNGIAHVIALAGYDVTMNDLAKERVEAAIGRSSATLAVRSRAV